MCVCVCVYVCVCVCVCVCGKVTGFIPCVFHWQVSESVTSSASSTLKGRQAAGDKAKQEKKGGLTAEERKRLTFTLEEIERER